MEDMWFDSQHLVAMNSLLFGTILPLVRSVINPRVYTPIMSMKSNSGCVCKFSHSPRSIKFSILGIFSIYCAQETYQSSHDDLSEQEKGYT
jgi:hypothetical protein